MRAQSTFIIGSLVGIAITQIAISRPGGASMPAQSSTANLTDDERTRQRLASFAAYAQRIGHPEIAREALSENAAGQTAHYIEEKAQVLDVFNPLQFARLAALWAGGLLMITNTFWILVFGGFAAALAYVPSVRDHQSMSHPVRSGVFAVLLIGVYIAVLAAADSDTQGVITYLATLLVVSVIVLAMLRTLRSKPEEWSGLRDSLLKFMRAFLLTALTLFSIVHLCGTLTDSQFGYHSMEGELLSIEGSDIGSVILPDHEPAFELIGAAAGLTFPLLMLISLIIAGRVRRVPVSMALVQGFRKASIPAACVLILLYGAFVLGTVRQERQMYNSLNQMVQHEGHYLSSLIGQSWPS